MTTKTPPYRLLPGIDRLVRLQADAPAELAKDAARRLVAELRARMDRGWPPAEGEDALLSESALAARLEELRRELTTRFHRRVINATGILLHTGLGRAPLPRAAIDAMREVAGQGYVEVEPESGKRGRRETAVAELLVALTGAEAATAVNNNAAATLLALDATARGGEVPVSRGELVEIGGGYRMPDVMRQAGCVLVEVGTTNRTKLSDYARVLNERTRCLLKVHPSNYRIEGFSEDVELERLVSLGREHGVPVIEDLGSGLMLDERLPHDAREPSVPQSVRSGADLVCFSGDKLLGTCQAGLLVGKRDAIARVAAHPLYRALRLSKLALAALEATLAIYRWGEPKREIPVLRATWRSLDSLRTDAEALREALEVPAQARGYAVAVEASKAYLGSGASPARAIESLAVRLRPDRPALAPEALARALRLARPAVFARIEHDSLVLDLRSLGAGEWRDVAEVFAAV